MELDGWLSDVRSLHDRAKRGELEEAAVEKYLAVRDDLAAGALAAQRLAAPEGVPPRRALRIARVLKIELTVNGDTRRGLTQDIGAAGAGVLLQNPPRVGEELEANLFLPGRKPIATGARVVAVDTTAAGSTRASIHFLAPPEELVEALEALVFEALLHELEQLARLPAR